MSTTNVNTGLAEMITLDRYGTSFPGTKRRWQGCWMDT
jgi:hypothetical protein